MLANILRALVIVFCGATAVYAATVVPAAAHSMSSGGD
jgi:hypothetical protein